MASQVSICNQAISWLSGNLIISIDDEIVEAKLCKANYDNVRDAVLEEKAWTFATRRYILPASAESDDWGYAYRFPIPSEVILIIHATDKGGVSDVGNTSFINQTDPNFDYRVEDGFIKSNSSIIYIKAIVQVTDTSKFTNGFVQAFATRLAAEIAIPLTESKRLQEFYWALYQKKLQIAGAADGIQGKSDILKSTRFTRVR